MKRKERHTFLQNTLQSHQVSPAVAKQNKLSCKIQRQHYLFFQSGRPICYQGWRSLHGDVCRTAINDLLKHPSRIPRTILNSVPERSLVNNAIRGFLLHLKEQRSHHDPVHKVYYLSEWFDKKEVYHRVFLPYFHDCFIPATPGLDGRTGSKSLFYKVWKDDFPDILTRQTAPPCPTCAKYTKKANEPGANPEYKARFQQKLDKHKRFVYTHLNKLNSQRAMANGDTTAATFIGLDYKEGMSIIRCNPNPAHLSMATMPKFLVGGYAFHDGRKNTAAYYIHTSHWSESTNSILSSLHHLLFTQWKGAQRPPVLYLMADTHSTNRSKVFLTYCFWLVRYLRLYTDVYLIFTPPYHGKSFVDQAHQGVAAEQKSREVIASLDTMVEVARRAKGRNFTTTALTDIWDWKSFFAPYMFIPTSISIPGEETSTSVSNTSWCSTALTVVFVGEGPWLMSTPIPVHMIFSVKTQGTSCNERHPSFSTGRAKSSRILLTRDLQQD